MRKTKIVIADDNREFCEVLNRLISSYEEFEIIGIAKDGAEALQIVESERPDVLILDIIMPHLDGLEVLERLHNLEEGYFPKVIVLSAVGQDKITQRAIELGAHYYVVKPFDFQVFIKRLKQISATDFTSNINDNKEVYTVNKAQPTESNLEARITKIIHEIGIPAH